MKKLFFVLICIVALSVVLGTVYWFGIRPAHIRANCQKIVDNKLRQILNLNGFQQNSNGQWIRRDERCVAWKETPQQPNQGRIDWLLLANRECERKEWFDVQPDVNDLKKNKQTAEEEYEPCLRRQGLNN